jgi:hypothetical protein
MLCEEENNMDTIKAVCKCKDFSEDDLVIAVKRSSFQFIKEWGFFTELMVVILTIATGGAWLFFVLGYKSNEIIGTKYSCQYCDAIIEKKNFRS